MRVRPSRRIVGMGVLLLLLTALLWVPEGAPSLGPQGASSPFVWGQDALWDALERRWDAARARPCLESGAAFEASLGDLRAQLGELEASARPSDDPRFERLEEALFEAALSAGTCPARMPPLLEELARLRRIVKDQSGGWALEARAPRDRLYRLLYARRAALEELLLQLPGADARASALELGFDEPSEAPSILVQGIRLHSGDVLASRGGAPTSALIARGNDYPGNFSHIALLHVSEQGEASVIESHIESGVGISSVERYLEDTKLRIMVLRLRADHPALALDPRLPHHAASDALENARAGHIPYDFAMDFEDPSKLFCSEVASSAYAIHGVELWRNLSSLSGPGLRRWLGALGVRHFETMSPSDIEYDPQLRVVAEWRDPEALFSAHLDDAILDVGLEQAEAGVALEHSSLRLPLARLAKAYSVILEQLGRLGPIPEGMSATSALKVEALRARHSRIRARLEAAAERYRRVQGRRPPYWTLVRLAREATAGG